MQTNLVIEIIQKDIRESKNRLLIIDSNKQSLLSDNNNLEKQITNIGLKIWVLENFTKKINSTQNLCKYRILKEIYIDIYLLFYDALKLVSAIHNNKIDLDLRFLKDFDNAMLQIKKNWLDSEIIYRTKAIYLNEMELKKLKYEAEVINHRIESMKALINMDNALTKR